MCWLSCSFSDTSSMDINTHPCIEDIKWQLSIASTDKLAENWSGFFSSVPFFCFFSFLWFLHVFQGSGFFLFTSYFSRLSTMDVFPTMGRHILTSHASNIYSLALLSEVHFPVLDKCMKLVFLSYYVWKQSNISTWSVAWSGNSLTRIRNEYHHFLFLYLSFAF